MFRHTRHSITAVALLIAAFGSLGMVGPAIAQGSAADLRAQYVTDLETMESKFNALAGAMDVDMYGWRPMDGVRSVSEVFMLIVAENYPVPSAWGAAAPAGMTVSPAMFGELAGVTDKASVVKQLAASFTYALGAVADIADDQMQQSIQMFGQESTVQGGLFLIVGDMHEHLGQAIAYARMNEVVPPWSAGQ